MSAWMLRDVDNRDEDGKPYEATDLSREQVIGYLDGPLRRDTLPRAHYRIDAAIEAIRQAERADRTFSMDVLGVKVAER